MTSSMVSRPMQRTLMCISVCLAVYLVVYCFFNAVLYPASLARLPQHERAFHDSSTPKPVDILIFAATKFFNMDITDVRFLSECSSSKDWCHLSMNGSDYEDADAVLFHNADFGRYHNSDVFKSRRLAVPYVLWSLESPSNDFLRPGRDLINWTMTYRRDADVWYPYGHMIRKRKRSEVDYEAIWSMKNKSLPPATWLASNCHASNGRQKIIQKLEEHGLKVDRWGRCGKRAPACDGVDKQGWDCVVQLIKPYKFYMAFENSDCKDYVTEKFYETLRSRMAVPIVSQRSIYEAVGIPSSSFIALSDFDSIEALAGRVVSVAQNKAAYLQYHKWREEYEVIPEHHDSTGFCELCRRLQKRKHSSQKAELQASAKSYNSVQIWHSNGSCSDSFSKKYLTETNRNTSTIR